MNKQTILFLSQADLYRAGVLNYRRAVEIAEKAIVDYSKGKILFPDKISQVFDKETQNRINCLPATLTEDKVCGVKWISVFPPNPKLNGLNNTNAVMILSSIEDGTNLAFMDGNVCSNLRTATINAVAAKYLSFLRDQEPLSVDKDLLYRLTHSCYRAGFRGLLRREIPRC